MARPRIEGHDGFLIPNASADGVSSPRMAEPDQLDFNTVAHAQWGVIEGCLVTISGTTAIINSGIAVVNGKLVVVNQAQISIATGTAQDRFDLIVVDSGGTPKQVLGLQALDPVFPDVPLESTLLAAVFVPAGAPDLTTNVIDKRKFVSKNLLTKIKEADDLIRNVNGTGDLWRVGGDGAMSWSGDSFLSRSAPETIRIHRHLSVPGNIVAGADLSAASVTAADLVTGRNLIYGPSRPALTDTRVGAIYSDSGTGRVYVRTATAWLELATTQSTSPVGTIIYSVQPPSVMQPLGWVALNGQTIQEADKPSLFSIPALQDYIHTNVGGTRYMDLPDLYNRVLLPRRTAGWFGPATREPVINQITLTGRQMPTHNHNVAVQDASASSRTRLTIETAPDGDHNHDVQQLGSRHTHPVKDPGHQHQGMDLDGTGRYPTQVISKVFGGQNKLDALFNDSNHTHSVEPVQWSMPAFTDISVGEAGSQHTHTLSNDGTHTHALTIRGDDLVHDHGVFEADRGQSDPIDITPSFFAVFAYIRS